jgi:transglutaminase-like putative cysteine protease
MRVVLAETDLEKYLRPTRFLDYDHREVRRFADETVEGVDDPVERATRLYLRVRDEIRYDPYRFSLAPEAMTASSCLERSDGFCVAKAVTLAAVGRAGGIPTRLGFADVRNHLATQKLLDTLGSDEFIWHGYMEFYLEKKWVKATPAFNIGLCDKFGVLPLEFSGHEDSIFHPYDRNGHRHMEYLRDHGTFEDLPLDRLIREYRAFYPTWGAVIEGDFGEDAESERSPKQLRA